MIKTQMSFYKEDRYSTIMKDVLIFDVTEKDAPSWVKVGAKYSDCYSLKNITISINVSLIIVDIFCLNVEDDNNKTYLIARLGWSDELKKTEQKIEVLIR